MVSAKDIMVKPINSRAANALVRKVHYSGKVVSNSQLHLGVFLNGKLEGVMSFGPSMDKRKIQGLVTDTGWNEFIELNRMAFSDKLPRNSESRALSVAFRLFKKHYPHIKWIISFADGAQCGDGTIYRASGFLLTSIRKNNSIFMMPDGQRIAAMTLEANWNIKQIKDLCDSLGIEHKYRTRTDWVKFGAKAVPGYQLRYIYFLDKDCKDKLTVPIIPFTEIDKIGAGMYLGETISVNDRRVKQAMDERHSSQRQGGTDQHAPIINKEAIK